jgi:hypothetical protein
MTTDKLVDRPMSQHLIKKHYVKNKFIHYENNDS